MMKFATLLEKVSHSKLAFKMKQRWYYFSLLQMQSYGLPPEGLLDNDPLANFDSNAAFDQCSLM